ncbi:hypothetical protein ACN2C3_00290 [Aliarcobacter butzleri]
MNHDGLNKSIAKGIPKYPVFPVPQVKDKVFILLSFHCFLYFFRIKKAIIEPNKNTNIGKNSS